MGIIINCNILLQCTTFYKIIFLCINFFRPIIQGPVWFTVWLSSYFVGWEYWLNEIYRDQLLWYDLINTLSKIVTITVTITTVTSAKISTWQQIRQCGICQTYRKVNETLQNYSENSPLWNRPLVTEKGKHRVYFFHTNF